MKGDGRIIADYGVHCPRCETPALGLGPTKQRAVADLRQRGWVLRKNLWFCCIACAEAQALRARAGEG